MRHNSIVELHRAKQSLGRDVLEQWSHAMMLRTVAQHLSSALLRRGLVHRQPMNSQTTIRLRFVPVHDHFALRFRDGPDLPDRAALTRGFQGIRHVLPRRNFVEFSRSAHLLRRNFLCPISGEHLANRPPESKSISFNRCCLKAQRSPSFK